MGNSRQGTPIKNVAAESSTKNFREYPHPFPPFFDSLRESLVYSCERTVMIISFTEKLLLFGDLEDSFIKDNMKHNMLTSGSPSGPPQTPSTFAGLLFPVIQNWKPA